MGSLPRGATIRRPAHLCWRDIFAGVFCELPRNCSHVASSAAEAPPPRDGAWSRSGSKGTPKAASVIFVEENEKGRGGTCKAETRAVKAPAKLLPRRVALR
jgi:hypothetical protein